MTILDEIVKHTIVRVEREKQSLQESSLKEQLKSAPQTRDFFAALEQGRERDGISVIAEIKRASPSHGELAPHLSIPDIVHSYEAGGAIAISVLCEPDFFHGGWEDIREVRRQTTLPILAKEFVIDEYQILRARLAGADAILLIVSLMRDKKTLLRFMDVVRRLGMQYLAEVHNEEEMELALDCGCPIIGVNNRNLKDFSVDVGTTLRLAKKISDRHWQGIASSHPSGAPRNDNDRHFLVSESGIEKKEDVSKLKKAGVGAILVGEALITSEDPASAIRNLLS